MLSFCSVFREASNMIGLSLMTGIPRYYRNTGFFLFYSCIHLKIACHFREYFRRSLWNIPERRLKLSVIQDSIHHSNCHGVLLTLFVKPIFSTSTVDLDPHHKTINSINLHCRNGVILGQSSFKTSANVYSFRYLKE